MGVCLFFVHSIGKRLSDRCAAVTPGGVHNPQDQAWLAAIRYAERTIFM